MKNPLKHTQNTNQTLLKTRVLLVWNICFWHLAPRASSRHTTAWSLLRSHAEASASNRMVSQGFSTLLRIPSPPILYINSLVRPSVRPVTLCVVTGLEPEPLLQFVPEISKRMLQQPVDCHNRRPLWCLFRHLLHFDPLLSFCTSG
jgi:hypothetical protein